MQKSYKTPLIFACAIIIATVVSCISVGAGLSSQRGTIDEDVQYSEQEDSLIKAVLVPRRGDILDCKGRTLATMTDVYDIYFDTTLLQDEAEWEKKADELSTGLAEILGTRSKEEFYSYLSDGRKAGKRYLNIQRYVSSDTLDELKKLPFFDMEPRDGGMILEKRQVRVYPYDSLARRTIGFVRNNLEMNNSHVGIEGRFDDILTGSYGYETFKFASNEEHSGSAGVGREVIARRDSVPGRVVRTTLDIDLQMKADSVLRSHIEDIEVIAGACLVLSDVKTGAIRSMVNLVRAGDGSLGEYSNIAIGRSYEAGAMLSPAVNIASSRCGERSFSVDAFYNRKDASFIEALRSIILGGSWDRDAWDLEGLGRFHCASPSDPDWSRSDLESIGKGFSIEATALDYLMLYTAIARGGRGVRLYLVQRGSEERYRLCSKRQAATLAESLLESASQNERLYGTVRTVAGITGSSFIVLENGRYASDDGSKAVQSSFSGFFPAGDPEYGVTCMIYTKPATDFGAATGTPSKVVSDFVNCLYE